MIVPKFRYNVFSREIKEAVKDELKKLCTWIRIEIIEGHVCKDYIHMCLAIPLKYAVSKFLKVLETDKLKTRQMAHKRVSSFFWELERYKI